MAVRRVTDREARMRALIETGVWPTAALIGDRPDLNGRECAFREALADEFGWRRVYQGGVVRWEKR